MDPLTHAISGAALARAFPKQALARRQTVFLILLTMAPDADIILRLFSDTLYLQHHRGITHSLLLLPLWVWLIHSLCFHNTRARQNKQRALITPWLIGLALLLHISLDLITTFGTMVLAPFSDWRASLDLLFIIDPLFTVCLLLPLLAGFVWPRHKRKLGMLSFVLMFSYLGLTYSNQQQAIELAKRAHPNANFYNALPLAFSPFHWQLIAAYPNHYARAAVNLKPDFSGSRFLFDEAFVTGLISSRMGEQDDLFWQRLPAMHSLEAVNTLPGIAFYRWFARYPVVLKKSDNFIEFGDLAFGGGAPGVHPSFQLHIELKHTDPKRSDSIETSAIATHAADNPQARAWLIWRNNSKSDLTRSVAPFSWLKSE